MVLLSMKNKTCHEFLNVWRGGSSHRGKFYNTMMIKNKWFWIVDALVWELDQKGLVGAVKSCILNITFLHCMQIGEICI